MSDWKKIGDICEIIRGNGVQKTDFVESGVGCIHYGQIYTHYGPFTYSTNKFVSKEVFEKARKASKGDIIMTDTSENVEDICKSVAYLGEEDIAVSNHALILKHKQNPKFLTYSTLTYSFLNQKRKYVVGAKVSGIKPENLAQIKIYLPSLSEQQRIVEQLDTFTSSIENLKEQIAQRRKQYEYYRDQLLDLEGKEGVERLALKEVCEVINGRAYSQPELLSDGKYRVLRVGNFFSNDSWYYSDLELENKYYCEKGDLLYAWSASFGPHIWEEEKVIYHYHIWKMDCSYRLNKKYMYYWLQSDDMKKQAFTNIHGATMAHLTKALMEALQVPVPSLQEQQRIVSILDTFEASIQNLEAQLELREKQYEYYRNKLLTFE